MPLPESLHLEIVTPEGRLVSEIVDEVILPGTEGSLGARPGHTPLLTSLGIGELSYRRGSDRRLLAIAWGFAEILPDRVSVLAEIAERAEQVDRDRATEARERALKRLRERAAETDFNRAQIALEKALIRLQVSERTGPKEPS